MNELKPGDAAPDFQAVNQNGDTVSLTDYKGKRLLIYFYPKVNTPGCTTQSCEVEKARPELNGLDTEVVGISPDSEEKQKKFADKYNLNFPLLCDEDHSIAERYGVWGEKKMYGKTYMGIVRSSFLVDESGTVIDVQYKVSPKDTVPAALKAIDKL